MKRFDGFLGKAGLVVATAVVTTTLAGSGVASAFNVPNNSVDSNKIVNESIRSIDIKNGTVASVDVRDNSLTTGDVLDSTITGSDIADSSIGGNDIAFGSVGGGDITDGSVLGADLANGTVTSSRPQRQHGDQRPTSPTARSARTTWRPTSRPAGPRSTAVPPHHFSVVGAPSAPPGPVPGTTWSRSARRSPPVAGQPRSTTTTAGSVVRAVRRRRAEQPGDNNSLRVRIFNAAGVEVDTPNDDGFTVTVVC